LVATVNRSRMVGKFLVGVIVLVALVATTGCGDIIDFDGGNTPPKKKQVASKKGDAKPKTVVVNDGMSKKQEKKLNERLDELEEKVDDQDEQASKDTTVDIQPEQQVEDQVRAAAEAYYAAVEVRAWGYTYDHLDSETQSAYSKNEWFAKNEWLANTGFVTYTIQSVEMDASAPDTLADVVVVLTTDGSTSIRNTYFVYEDGIWKHRFGTEEYNLLATAGTASASASASSGPSASASAGSSVNRGVMTPVSKYDCPPDAPIKGNQTGIYHVPGGAYYDETTPEKCFATTEDAENAGYRASSQ
jgi:hypothetical protein